MEYELTPEQQQFQLECHDYVKTKLSPALVAHSEINKDLDIPTYRQYTRQLGADGWLGMGWPKEYEGQGRSAIDQYTFIDVFWGYYLLTLPLFPVWVAAGILMKVGTEEQKKQILPGIREGKIMIALGLTEPEAGTDVASLQTRAVKNGDDYIINGQKVFISHAHWCDYIWIAARTDPDAPKDKGISLFLVDSKTPGITIEPLYCMFTHRANSVFLDDVRIPKSCLVGEENLGMQYIAWDEGIARFTGVTRLALGAHSRPMRIIDDMIKWASETKVDRIRVIENPWVKNKLAELAVGTEVLRLLNYRVAWLLTQGIAPIVEAAGSKVYGAEHLMRVLRTSLQIMGPYGQLQPGSKWAPFRGRLERQFREAPLWGFEAGSNEIMRSVIGMMGLGLPQ
ncbi:acyl-CoA dehydrogenase family protein [Chloroflexota bacterium]